MARKRTKEEAKERIRSLPLIPDLQLPIGGPTIGELAEAFVESDPLNRLADDNESVRTRSRPVQGPSKADFLRNQAIMMAMVNDPEFVLDKDAVDLINNQERLLVSDGNGMVEVNGRDVIRRSGQFRRDMILPRTNQKRMRKKTKTDKKMSKALREANARLRTKKGTLRKGKTQADVMRLAHRLRKKMS